MRILLLIGGLLGFSVGLLFSWAEQSSGPACLWHACLAAYVAAVLMRWWGNAWRKNLVESLRERESAPEPVHAASLSKVNKS
jgi:hypothetical protein